jgi:hypothetical protein
LLKKLRDDEIDYHLNDAECDIVRNISDVPLLVEIIATSPNLLYKLIQPTPELCLLAVQKEHYVLRFIEEKDQTPELALAACKANGGALRGVAPHLLSRDLCEAAIMAPKCSEISPFECLMRHFLDQARPLIEDLSTDPNICSKVIRTNPTDLCYIKNQTPELCQLAVDEDVHAFPYVNKDLQTPEMCLKAVQENGLLVKYVRNDLMTPQICLAAVQQNGLAAQLIKYKTPEICLAAIQQQK